MQWIYFKDKMPTEEKFYHIQSDMGGWGIYIVPHALDRQYFINTNAKWLDETSQSSIDPEPSSHREESDAVYKAPCKRCGAETDQKVFTVNAEVYDICQVCHALNNLRFPGFHSKNGLFFRRMSDGSVMIFKHEKNEYGNLFTAFCDVLTADVWASVVSSVSVGGENRNRWLTAKDFHQHESGASLSAGEGEAVAFGEFLRRERWQHAGAETNLWYRNIEGYRVEKTTADLYKIYKGR